MNLSAVASNFNANFTHRQELGASVCVMQAGKELLSLADGWQEKEQKRNWTPQTLAPVYSATKGPAAATLLLVLEESGLTPSTQVQHVWPRFPADINFAQLLSHQAGLAALDQTASIFDYDQVIHAIESQTPNWRPGQAHGYHPRTFGFLLDHPVRLLTGSSLGQTWQQAIAQPLKLDFWIGLPAEQHAKVAKLYPGRMQKDPGFDAEFYRNFLRRGTLTQRAFTSPRGIHSVAEMNDPAAYSAELPAFGGIGTARSLAAFYQALLGTPSDNCPNPFNEKVRQWINVRLIQGQDQIMHLPTAFHAGFMTDPIAPDGSKLRKLYGPHRHAFGHPGSGGSHAFADPESGISFAYTMNQMELSLFPGPKSLDLIAPLFNQG